MPYLTKSTVAQYTGIVRSGTLAPETRRAESS